MYKMPFNIENPVIMLSIGSEVDFQECNKTDAVKELIDHLTSAIINERIAASNVSDVNRAVDLIMEEVVFIVQNSDRGLLDLVLFDFIYKAVLRKISKIS